MSRTRSKRTSNTSENYFVEYYPTVNGKDTQSTQTKKFDNRDRALNVAEQLERRKQLVQVTNRAGKRIYPPQTTTAN